MEKRNENRFMVYIKKIKLKKNRKRMIGKELGRWKKGTLGIKERAEKKRKGRKVREGKRRH